MSPKELLKTNRVKVVVFLVPFLAYPLAGCETLPKRSVLMQGEKKESICVKLKDNIRIRLESLKLYSPDLAGAHVVLMEILTAHYRKLLDAEGNTFSLLLEHAYQHRNDLNQFIETITSAENEVDRQVIEQLGGEEKVKDKILAEQQQIAKRRQKILEEVFW